MYDKYISNLIGIILCYIDKHYGYFTYTVRSQEQISKLTSQQFTRDNAYLTKVKMGN